MEARRRAFPAAMLSNDQDEYLVLVVLLSQDYSALKEAKDD